MNTRRVPRLFARFAPTERKCWHLEDGTLRLNTACYTTAELDEIDGTATRICYREGARYGG
jgi:hypothetical protein